MDARHEPFQQEILNQLITTINIYIKNNTDKLVITATLHKAIKDICRHIYLYSKRDVDVDGILSKHNLLSIDVVFFPLVVVENNILSDTDFNQLMLIIHSSINQDPSFHVSEKDFIQQIDQIIQQSEMKQGR